MNKQECENALYEIKYPSKEFYVFERLIEEHFELENKHLVVLKKYDDLFTRYKKLVEIKPFEFEDLRPNMWVYDDYRKTCLKIHDFYTCGNNKIFRYRSILTGQLIHERLEKNRLFPLSKANEDCNGC